MAANWGEQQGSRRSVRVLVLGALLVPLLAGCLASDFTYVKSSADRTYFKLPKEWKLYDEDAILKNSSEELTQEEIAQARAGAWRAAFDASPSPSVRRVSNIGGRYPAGQAIVRAIGFEEADQLSMSYLRNLVYPVDDSIEGGTAEVIAYEPTSEDGFRGIRMTVRVTGESGSSATFSQVAMVDAKTSKVYMLLVGCMSSCFQHYRSDINTIVNSWTVRER